MMQYSCFRFYFTARCRLYSLANRLFSSRKPHFCKRGVASRASNDYLRMLTITAIKPLISVTMAAQNCTSRVAVLRAWRWRLFESCSFKRFLVRFLCLMAITSFNRGKLPASSSTGRGFLRFTGLPTFPVGQPSDPKKLR